MLVSLHHHSLVLWGCLLSNCLHLTICVCVCQDIRLPSSSPIACISEAICLCFIFLHDLLSSSLNPAKVLSSTNPAKDKAPLVISLPISLAFYVLLLKSEHKSHIIHYLVSLQCTGCTGRGRQRGRERISTGRLDPATIDVLLVELSTQPWCGSHPYGAGAPAGITLQRTSCWSASSIAGISVWVAPSWRFGAEHLGTAAASDSCRRHHNEREVTESFWVLTISTSQAS